MCAAGDQRNIDIIQDTGDFDTEIINSLGYSEMGKMSMNMWVTGRIIETSSFFS